MEVSWLYLIPLLPLAGAAVNGLLGRWLPKAWLYAVALLVVLGVGFLIHLYSVGYMDEDPGYWRYFAYLNLFVSMMLLLVLSDNLVAMFVGWEGVGLCSYLLVGFWYDDDAKAYAGRKAFIVNRIGDFGFLIGIFVLYLYTGQVSFQTLKVAPLSLGVASAAAALLFVGATGKSAQLPLYVWLPDAMAGPTPVSALIHAATMVTAGVYMVARLSFLYVQAPGVMAVVATIGVLTAFWGAVIGTAQMDIKRVLAYSTVSQLGYMFVGVGVGAFAAGTAHLITHAFFKACLFLGAGAVIHGLHGEQNMSKMGGLRKYMPHTAWTFAIATVAISGIIPISGFFSKDEILAQALHTRSYDFLTMGYNGPHLTFLGTGIYVTGSLTALITSFYMWRCYFLTFEGEYRGPDEVHPHESPGIMTAPLWVLAALSVVGLALGLPEHWVHGTSLESLNWERFTARLFSPTRSGPPGEFSVWPGYFVALAVAWAGFGLARIFYAPARAATGDERLTAMIPRLRNAFANKFWVDEFYGWLIV